MHRVLRIVLAMLVSGCATGPDESLATILVEFDQAPSDADVASVIAVGGRLQRRIEIARALAVRAPLSVAAGYAAIPGVRGTGSLGGDDDPDVSIFIATDGAPTAEDVAFVRASGARSAHVVAGEPTIAAVLPLSRVQELADRIRFRSVDIVLETFRIEP